MSGAYGEPDWASPGATSTVTATQDAATSSAITAPDTSGGTGHAKFLLVLLSLADMACAALMCALGVLALIDFNIESINDVSAAFLAVYMILFALLLLLYECMWWQGIPFLNKMLRRNFGFMYGLKGKAFYMIFIAFLTIGFADYDILRAMAWATGISMLGVGCVTIFLICTNPELSQAYQPPTSGLTSPSEEATQEQPNPV